MEIKRVFDFTNEKYALSDLRCIMEKNFNCIGIDCKNDNCPFEIDNGCLIGRLINNIEDINRVIKNYENNN